MTIPDPLPRAVLDRNGWLAAIDSADTYRFYAEKYGPFTDLYPRDPEPENKPETVWRTGDDAELFRGLLTHAQGNGLAYTMTCTYEGYAHKGSVYRFPFVLPAEQVKDPNYMVDQEGKL